MLALLRWLPCLTDRLLPGPRPLTAIREQPHMGWTTLSSWCLSSLFREGEEGLQYTAPPVQGLQWLQPPPEFNPTIRQGPAFHLTSLQQHPSQP